MNKRTILSYAVGPIGTGILGLINLPLITWFYSVEDVGRISMLQVVVSFSILLCCLGLDQAYAREYHEVNKKDELLKLCLYPGLSVALLTYSLIYIFKPALISNLLYGVNNNYLSLISIICLILSIVSRFFSLVLRMEERALAFSMSQLLPKSIFLIFILSTVWLGLQKNIYTLVTAHFLSIFSVFLILSWNTRKEWLTIFTHRVSLNRIKPLIYFGLPLVIGGLASWGLNVMDRLFLRSLSTFAELGVYSVTMSVTAIATVLSSIFNTIWSPLVYKWVSTEEADLSKIDEISEYLLATIFFIIVLSGLFSWILPFLLPNEYEDIQYLLTPCLLAPLMYTLSETTAVGIAISRKTSFSMIASIVAMLCNAFGNYLLVPAYGATGAATSTALSFFIFYILRTEFSKLVWREIPSTKSYIVMFGLILVVIINSFFLKETKAPIIIWCIILIIGVVIFKKPLKSLIDKTKSHIA